MNKTLPPNPALSETETIPTSSELAGLLYHDDEFFAYEADRVFRPSGRSSATSTTFPTRRLLHLRLLGESVLALRGDDGAVRAFQMSAGTARRAWSMDPRTLQPPG